MAIFLCVVCGAEMKYPPSQARKFCSPECRARGPINRPERTTCRSCSTWFSPTSARQLNCAECSPTKGARARLRRYGVTASQWEAFRDRYDGACWLCRDRPATCLDHEHATETPRGALCRTCNMALHYLENEAWAAAAEAYLGRG